MVAVKVLCNDSAPKSVPALQRDDGLHQPEKKYPDSYSLSAWLFL